jgi:hypothetical protein
MHALGEIGRKGLTRILQDQLLGINQYKKQRLQVCKVVEKLRELPVKPTDKSLLY